MSVDFKKIGTSALNLLAGLAGLFAYMSVQGMFLVKRTQHLSVAQYARPVAATLVCVACLSFIYMLGLLNNEWSINSDWLQSLTAKQLRVTLGAFAGILVIQFFAGQLLAGTSNNQMTINALAGKCNIYLFKAELIVIAPVFEELIFRGFFFDAFFTKPSKVNLIVGSLTSGFAFALLHGLPTNLFFVIYWLMGTVLALTYLTTGDLRCSILAHMAVNLLGVFTQF